MRAIVVEEAPAQRQPGDYADQGLKDGLLCRVPREIFPLVADRPAEAAAGWGCLVKTGLGDWVLWVGLHSRIRRGRRCWKEY